MPTRQGTTLYLCLEDSMLRIQNRLFEITEDAPPNVHFCTEIITLWVTPRVKAAIQARAKRADMTVTDYLCLYGLGKKILQVDGLGQVLTELKAQGRNLKLVTGWNCTAQSVWTEIRPTKERFRKMDGRQYYHFVQSHVDTEHLHNHLVVNSASFRDGRKLHQSAADLQAHRLANDEICAPRSGASAATSKAGQAEAAAFLAAQAAEAFAPAPAPSAPADPTGAAGLVGGLVRLEHALECAQDSGPVADSTLRHAPVDHKAREQQRQKRLAMGHKADDHEEASYRWEQIL